MTTLMLALMFAAQEPVRTVEDRLKELEAKLTSLEKRNKELETENQALEKRISDGKAAKENYVRQVAAGWVRRYATPLGLTEKQSAELEELWLGWTRADLEKAADAAAWTSREAAVKSKLTEDQVPRLARAVRDEQEKTAKLTLSFYMKNAAIAAERMPAFEKAVLSRLAFTEDTLLPQAHPEKQVGWPKLLAAMEESLPDLATVLSEEEQTRLRETISKLKPRK